MDRADAQAWLDRYMAAWLSYDANDIAALFTEDVAYRYHPYDESITGRKAVVASWLGEDTSNGASTRDAPAHTRHTTNRSPSTMTSLLRRAPRSTASGLTVRSHASMTTAS